MVKVPFGRQNHLVPSDVGIEETDVREHRLSLLAPGYDALANVASLGFGHAAGIVAAAEAAIGLAILVVLFRSRQTINVADLDTLKG